MFCRKCGKEIKDGARFCPYCGQRVEGPKTEGPSAERPAVQSPAAESVEPVESAEPVRKPGVSKGLIAAITGGILVAAAVVSVFVFFPDGFGKDTKNSGQEHHAAASVEEPPSEAEETKQTEEPLSKAEETKSTEEAVSEANEPDTSETLSAETPPPVPEQSSGAEISEFILPESNIRYMTYNDLQGLDADTLRIAKNEIYARHGRLFQSEDLSRYFNSKSWYKGTVSPDSFSDSVFNDYEKGNISLIIAFQEGIPDGGYSGFDFVFSCFALDDGILTVIAESTSWGGAHDEGFAFSLPLADDCRWEAPYTDVKKNIDGGRELYFYSPDTYQSPADIGIIVQNGMVAEVTMYIP